MTLSAALLVLGIGQAVIFFVVRLFVKRAVVGEPSWLLKTISGLIGVIAVALFAAALWMA